MSSTVGVSFDDLIDDSLSTGVVSDAADSQQWLSVSFGETLNIGAVFVFVDEALHNAGTLRVHAYSGAFDQNDASQECGELLLGGVLNCNKAGDGLTVFCPNGCTTRLAIRMLRVWNASAVIDGLTVST